MLDGIFFCSGTGVGLHISFFLSASFCDEEAEFCFLWGEVVAIAGSGHERRIADWGRGLPLAGERHSRK